jgi:hypothetical protein
VAEGARLESVYALIAYRGFESLSHRHILKTPQERGFDNLKILIFYSAIKTACIVKSAVIDRVNAVLDSPGIPSQCENT